MYIDSDTCSDLHPNT